MQQQKNAKIKKEANSIQLDLGSGIRFEIDLTQRGLDKEQHRILEKAANAMREVEAEVFLNPEACTKTSCPSEPYLDKQEFEKIRDLKARVGAIGGGQVAGPFIDFCFKVINV